MWHGFTLNWVEDLVYIYNNNKLLQERPKVIPITLYEKNMLFKHSMFNVDESSDKGDTLQEDPLMSNEDED
jgi:hypothetical protein